MPKKKKSQSSVWVVITVSAAAILFWFQVDQKSDIIVRAVKSLFNGSAKTGEPDSEQKIYENRPLFNIQFNKSKADEDKKH